MEAFTLVCLKIKYKYFFLFCEYYLLREVLFGVFEVELHRYFVKVGNVFNYYALVEDEFVVVIEVFGSRPIKNEELVLLLLVHNEVLARDYR